MKELISSILVLQGYIVELNSYNTNFYFTTNVLEACIVHGTVQSPISHDVMSAPFIALPEHDELQVSMFI